jgi:ATP-binding cassette subfamily B (MDR/TAP) protein 1
MFSFRYNEHLIKARDFGIKKGLLNGVSLGVIYLILFCTYALGFWYGSTLVFDEEITPGNLLIVSKL